mmetsp:Transcript_11620/g.17323  ORF Transcript_11620/g.17323 Transcript_11620/m.17323 type:complete len:82 (+) Transcript_11620:178-423(+)
MSMLELEIGRSFERSIFTVQARSYNIQNIFWRQHKIYSMPFIDRYEKKLIFLPLVNNNHGLEFVVEHLPFEILKKKMCLER